MYFNEILFEKFRKFYSMKCIWNRSQQNIGHLIQAMMCYAEIPVLRDSCPPCVCVITMIKITLDRLAVSHVTCFRGDRHRELFPISYGTHEAWRKWWSYCRQYIQVSEILTCLLLDKMASISQTIFGDAFSLMKNFAFWLKFHWSLFLWVQWIITQHWFR